MQIEFMAVGPLQVNCAVVWGGSKQALVIDPGFDAPLILSCIAENHLSAAAYLLTHSHTDHLNALAEIHAVHPAPVYIHTRDCARAFRLPNRVSPHYPVPRKPDAEFVHPEFPLLGKNGEKSSRVWKISDLSFQCLETPGHTPGGICYWFEEDNLCFTGDTLLKGSRGRIIPFVGDAKAMQQSLKRLAGLPPETRIIPGHGDETTIRHELETNPFLKRAVRCS
jgi:glyoxylase-like metal-dependent hydrolase (beta-lactamase superfamily II)